MGQSPRPERPKCSLWEAMQHLFASFEVSSMREIYEAIVYGCARPKLSDLVVNRECVMQGIRHKPNATQVLATHRELLRSGCSIFEVLSAESRCLISNARQR